MTVYRLRSDGVGWAWWASGYSDTAFRRLCGTQLSRAGRVLTCPSHQAPKPHPGLRPVPATIWGFPLVVVTYRLQITQLHYLVPGDPLTPWDPLP